MHYFLFAITFELLLRLPSFALSLEEAKNEIGSDESLEPAEKERQIAGLYRLSGNPKKSFEVLCESLDKGIFNDWMLEDFFALGKSLSKENLIQSSTKKLLKSDNTQHQLAGILLKGLSDLNQNPENVLKSLRQFSKTHAGEKVNGLFLLLLQRAYIALGNDERYRFFASIMEKNFPDYYILRKKSKISTTGSNSLLLNKNKLLSNLNEKKRNVTLLQVRSFKKEQQKDIKNLQNHLKKLGLEFQEKISSDDDLQVYVLTTNPKETIKLLRREKINFYDMQNPPSLTQQIEYPISSYQPKGTTVQVGVFSTVQSANAFKKTLIKDGFTDINIAWKDENRLFYVFLQCEKPKDTLKTLKEKGYDAFIRNWK